MAKIEILVPKILKWEGGYINHPNDKGGPTNKGITIHTFSSYRKNKGMLVPTIEDLKNISKEEWMDIFKIFYWDKWKADRIFNQSIANLLVDWVWGSGNYGIKYPQQVLNVKSDGIVGEITLSALNKNSSQRELFQKLWERRKSHFINIVQYNPSQAVFLKGWLNRLNDFTFEI